MSDSAKVIASLTDRRSLDRMQADLTKLLAKEISGAEATMTAIERITLLGVYALGRAEIEKAWQELGRE